VIAAAELNRRDISLSTDCSPAVRGQMDRARADS
jgi:hypothetical protein